VGGDRATRRLNAPPWFAALRTSGSSTKAIILRFADNAFGKICEYFLGAFAMKEGQKGGEFFTPLSMVDLIVNVIEPYHGRLFDRPAAAAACSCRANIVRLYRGKEPESRPFRAGVIFRHRVPRALPWAGG
jgi:hypothetical protein